MDFCLVLWTRNRVEESQTRTSIYKIIIVQNSSEISQGCKASTCIAEQQHQRKRSSESQFEQKVDT